LIKKGHVYVAQPPLYRVDAGKDTFWAKDEADLQALKEKLKNRKTEVTRFKGLGEMDYKDLAQTTLDPRKRRLLKVEIDNPLDADQVFQQLLGKDAESRYTFIMEKATEADAERLDV
jgi:DNA gyrase/topoisomerase IV subunit B